MNVIFLTNNYNIYNQEQRLIQKLGYYKISNYLKELSCLGFEYSFSYPLVLTIKSTKNFFFTLPLFRINEYIRYTSNIRDYSSLSTPTNTKLNNYTKYFKINKFFDILNSFSGPLYILTHTGSKAKLSQIHQLVGIRGYLSGLGDYNLNLPVLNNFRKGLNIFEYFISCVGARKGVVDTAIKTADSGYLTKRLVEVTQETIIKEYNCGTNNSCFFTQSTDYKGKLSLPYYLIIYSKLLRKNLVNLVTKEIIISQNMYVHPSLLDVINTNKYQFHKIVLNSIKLCSLQRTVCSNCLGTSNISNNSLSSHFGILVGQTVGEPSTQLTLKTFHTGGVYTIKSEENQHIIIGAYNPVKRYRLCSPVKKKRLEYHSNKFKSNKKSTCYDSLLPSVLKKQYFKQYKFRWSYIINNVGLCYTLYKEIYNSLYQKQSHTENKNNIFYSIISLHPINSINVLAKTKYNKWVFTNVGKYLNIGNSLSNQIKLPHVLLSITSSFNINSCVVSTITTESISYSTPINMHLISCFYVKNKVKTMQEELEISTLSTKLLKFKKMIYNNTSNDLRLF